MDSYIRLRFGVHLKRSTLLRGVVQTLIHWSMFSSLLNVRFYHLTTKKIHRLTKLYFTWSTCSRTWKRAITWFITILWFNFVLNDTVGKGNKHVWHYSWKICNRRAASRFLTLFLKIQECSCSWFLPIRVKNSNVLPPILKIWISHPVR